MLHIVSYQKKRWFFDRCLRQLRNVRNPHDSIALNDFEVKYFRKRGKVDGEVPSFSILFSGLGQERKPCKR